VIAKAAKAYKAAEKQAVNDGDPDWKETAIKAANEAAAAEVAKYRTLVVGNVKALEVAAKKAPKAEVKPRKTYEEQVAIVILMVRFMMIIR